MLSLALEYAATYSWKHLQSLSSLTLQVQLKQFYFFSEVFPGYPPPISLVYPLYIPNGTLAFSFITFTML